LSSATIGGGGLSGVGASGVGVMRRYRCCSSERGTRANQKLTPLPLLLIGARNKGQSKTYAKAPSVNASKFCNTFGGKADIRQNSRNVCLLGYHHVLRHHGNGVWLERDDFLGTWTR
jgi:hypothetical protein